MKLKTVSIAKPCKVCKPCPHCYDVSEEKLREYVYRLDELICQYNESSICFARGGYGKKCLPDEDFKNIHTLRGPLNRYYQSLRRREVPGLCPEEIQRILEASSKFVSLMSYQNESFSDVTVDDSMFDEWVVLNPYCIAYEDWEKSTAKVCPRVGITVKKIEDACNFILEFTTNVIPKACEILYTLSVASQAKCSLSYDVDIKNLATCKIRYEALVSETGCKFSFDNYVSLLNCNLSHQVINNLITCGVGLDIDVKDNCPLLSINDNEYRLDDIEVDLMGKGVNDPSIINVLKVSKEDLSKNFLQKLIDSYNNLPS